MTSEVLGEEGAAARADRFDTTGKIVARRREDHRQRRRAALFNFLHGRSPGQPALGEHQVHDDRRGRRLRDRGVQLAELADSAHLVAEQANPRGQRLGAFTVVVDHQNSLAVGAFGDAGWGDETPRRGFLDRRLDVRGGGREGPGKRREISGPARLGGAVAIDAGIEDLFDVLFQSAGGARYRGEAEGRPGAGEAVAQPMEVVKRARRPTIFAHRMPGVFDPSNLLRQTGDVGLAELRQLFDKRFGRFRHGRSSRCSGCGV